MKNTALITGASNGIGLELAKVHASKGGDLVLVARSKSRLDELKTELENRFKISVLNIPKDLSLPGAAKEIYSETTRLNIQIDYLINNAGFGVYGMFDETNWENEHQMINLNISALTQFTKLYLRDMIKRRSGKIMNVASTASFQPGPAMAVYCATKAYVLNFSEAVGSEVRDKGITVTALCPGATKTGFQEVGGIGESKIFKNKKLPDAKEVANFGYASMMKGKSVAIHGIKNYILANSIRFIPRTLVTKVSLKILEKSG